MDALLHGVITVVIPKDNQRDLGEIDQTVRKALNFVTAQTMDTVLEVALNPSSNAMTALIAEIPEERIPKSRKMDIRQ